MKKNLTTLFLALVCCALIYCAKNELPEKEAEQPEVITKQTQEVSQPNPVSNENIFVEVYDDFSISAFKKNDGYYFETHTLGENSNFNDIISYSKEEFEIIKNLLQEEPIIADTHTGKHYLYGLKDLSYESNFILLDISYIGGVVLVNRDFESFYGQYAITNNGNLIRWDSDALDFILVDEDIDFVIIPDEGLPMQDSIFAGYRIDEEESPNIRAYLEKSEFRIWVTKEAKLALDLN